MSASCKPSFEGKIPFPYQGETFETYVRVYGDLKESKKTPLVVLHGGPGLSSDYLVNMSDLASNYDTPVLVYDQVGNARSTHLREKPQAFWTIDLFIDELENLLHYFGISEKYDLFGHSWGGILGLEFEVRRQPKGLRKFVVANSLASFQLWLQSVTQLCSALPKEVGEGVAAGMSDPKRYAEALKVFHSHHGCTVKPMPTEYSDTIDWIFAEHGDPTVANAPILNNWSIIDRLHLVRVPVLLINGKLDISQDFVVRPLFDGIQKVKWVTFNESSHTPNLEERDKFMKLVSEYLE